MPRHDEASTRSAEGCPSNRVPRQEAAPNVLVELEWPANAHIEAHATAIAAGEVDAFLGRDLLVGRPGATTFSLSVLPEGSGRLVARSLCRRTRWGRDPGAVCRQRRRRALARSRRSDSAREGRRVTP